MSQKEVADKIGMTQSFVAKIELGERRVDVVEFLRLIDALNASRDAILDRVAKNDK